jgi:ParB-like chromosome segregation protein Spo0J
MHQNIELSPAKLETTIVRLRQAGQCAPIIVRRITDGYVLVDGLYRLTVARELGWEQLPAIVE